MKMRIVAAAVTMAAVLAGVGAAQAGAPVDEPLVGAFDNLSRNNAWTLASQVSVKFDDNHPQSLEIVGDKIWMSSVEIITRTDKAPCTANPADPICGGSDRTPGEGRAHLYVMDMQGNLEKDIILPNVGNSYHPGGLDVSGDTVYVPVAEYRPNSNAVVYKVDTKSFAVTEMFDVKDHVGGVIYDESTGHLVGQSWGSRRFYDWKTDGTQVDKWLNEHHFLDYQDCEYVKARRALCSGVTGLPAPKGSTASYELGGFVLTRLTRPERSRGDAQPAVIEHEVPLQLWSDFGHNLTRNPTDLAVSGDTLTLTAVPDDSNEQPAGSVCAATLTCSMIYVYKTKVTPLS